MSEGDLWAAQVQSRLRILAGGDAKVLLRRSSDSLSGCQ